MKLFKKLAAAALAAVLALSMVGCGAGSKGSTSTASEFANVLADFIPDRLQIGAEHTGEMDNLAAALATSAGNAENAEEKKIEDLLKDTTVLQNAGLDLQNTAYFVSYVENYKPQSPFTPEEQKIGWMVNQTLDLDRIQPVGKSVNPSNVNALELGAGTVKIGDKEYIVVVAKSVETPVPDTTTEE